MLSLKAKAMQILIFMQLSGLSEDIFTWSDNSQERMKTLLVTFKG